MKSLQKPFTESSILVFRYIATRRLHHGTTGFYSGEISDLEIQLAHANRQFSDASRANKDISGQIKDVQMSIDDSDRQADDIKVQKSH